MVLDHEGARTKEESAMHPDIVQSLAAERVRDMRKRAPAARRRGIARRVLTPAATAVAHAGRRLAHA